MIKVYLFDLWGTLAYLENKDKFPKDEEQLIKKFKDVDLTNNEKEDCKNKTKEQKICLYKDSKEIITKLKKKGFKTAIISNIYELTGEMARRKLKDFFGLFDFLAFSYELGIAKPNEKIFKIVLKNLGAEPNEAVMIGDDYDKDIAPAEKLGIPTIFIDRTKQSLKELI